MPKISIRPLIEEDISHMVNYWFESSDEDLTRMATDKLKLGSKQEFFNNILAICNTPIETTKHFYMTWLIDNEPVGHNTLRDIVTNEIGHMHLHMWRSKYRGQGFGPLLFCKSAVEFYKLFGLKIILCEPHALNPMPNKMLNKIGYKKWKTYYAQSSELALPCNVNSYIIDLETSLTFLNNKSLTTSTR